jgi:hypothetical protein
MQHQNLKKLRELIPADQTQCSGHLPVIHECPSACDAIQNTLEPSFVYRTLSDTSAMFALPFIQLLAELLEVIHFSTLKPFQIVISSRIRRTHYANGIVSFLLMLWRGRHMSLCMNNPSLPVTAL